MGRGDGGQQCPAVQGPLGISAAGREAKRSAFGHAAAKAKRTRLAISMTRAAILMRFEAKRRELRLGEVARLGNGVPHGEHQPEGGGVQNETNLVGAG